MTTAEMALRKELVGLVMEMVVWMVVLMVVWMRLLLRSWRRWSRTT